MIKAVKSHLSRANLILVLILLLAFFFRFYKLTELFSFGMDQEYEAFLVKNIVEGKHFPLIGVNASDTGLYLGPLFIYLAVLPYALFRGNPIGFAVFASLLGVFTTYMVYFLIKKMFSEKVGIYSAFFYAVSFLASYYDRNFWNPTFVPLLSLLIGFLLNKINNKQSKYLIYLALVFGLSFHTHLSLLIFTPLIIWVITKNLKYIRKKLLIWSIILFIGIQLPQIIFELRHNFTNTKAAINLMTGLTQNNINSSTLNERSNIFVNLLGRFVWVPPMPDLFDEKGLCRDLSGVQKNAYPEIIGVFFLILSYFYYCHIRFKNNKSDESKIVMSIFLLSFFAVFLYRRDFSEYYFLFLIPYLAVIIGISLNYLMDIKHGNIIVYLFISLFFGMNIVTLATAKTSYSHLLKLDVIDFSRKYVGTDSYNLEALGDCPRFAGWQYLFTHHLGKPAHSYMDSYYEWLYFDKSISDPAKNIILLSMIDPMSGQESVAKWGEDKINFLSKYNIKAQKIFDKIHVFILSPKK